MKSMQGSGRIPKMAARKSTTKSEPEPGLRSICGSGFSRRILQRRSEGTKGGEEGLGGEEELGCEEGWESGSWDYRFLVPDFRFEISDFRLKRETPSLRFPAFTIPCLGAPSCLRFFVVKSSCLNITRV
jgi:hypothetical protein